MGAEACRLRTGPTLLAAGSAAAALSGWGQRGGVCVSGALVQTMCSGRVLGVFGALNRHLHIQTPRAV